MPIYEFAVRLRATAPNESAAQTAAGMFAADVSAHPDITLELEESQPSVEEIDVEELSARAQRNSAGECLQHEDADLRASGRHVRDAGKSQGVYVVDVIGRADGLYLFTGFGASRRFARSVEAAGGEVALSEEPLIDGEIALQHLVAAELCVEGRGIECQNCKSQRITYERDSTLVAEVLEIRAGVLILGSEPVPQRLDAVILVCADCGVEQEGVSWEQERPQHVPPGQRALHDEEALNELAACLNRPGSWSERGVCDAVAALLARTGRKVLNEAEKEEV